MYICNYWRKVKSVADSALDARVRRHQMTKGAHPEGKAPFLGTARRKGSAVYSAYFENTILRVAVKSAAFMR